LHKTTAGFTLNHTWFQSKAHVVFIKITLGFDQNHTLFLPKADVVLKKEELNSLFKLLGSSFRKKVNNRICIGQPGWLQAIPQEAYISQHKHFPVKITPIKHTLHIHNAGFKEQLMSHHTLNNCFTANYFFWFR